MTLTTKAVAVPAATERDFLANPYIEEKDVRAGMILTDQNTNIFELTVGN
jgi:hypothetical protein